VEESLDRLSRLVENLLDMSRLQAGALAMTPQAMSMAESIATALDEIGPVARNIDVRVPDELPEVHADPVARRAGARHMAQNAIRYSDPDSPPMITVSEHAGLIETRVVDRGPGSHRPVGQRLPAVPAPWRQGQRHRRRARARPLARACGGDWAAASPPDTTPGGGLTMTLCLPREGVR